MHKYLKLYIQSIEKLLKENKKSTDFQELKTEILVKIKFFQHERLVHLLVTLFFGLITVFATFNLHQMSQWVILTSMPLLLILLLAYVFHYFHLENGVQKLYKLHDEVGKMLHKKS